MGSYLTVLRVCSYSFFPSVRSFSQFPIPVFLHVCLFFESFIPHLSLFLYISVYISNLLALFYPKCLSHPFLPLLLSSDIDIIMIMLLWFPFFDDQILLYLTSSAVILSAIFHRTQLYSTESFYELLHWDNHGHDISLIVIILDLTWFYLTLYYVILCRIIWHMRASVYDDTHRSCWSVTYQCRQYKSYRQLRLLIIPYQINFLQ